MERSALHLEIRNALSIADELSRHEHSLGNDDLAGCFAAFRGALGHLERNVGRSHEDAAPPPRAAVLAVERALDALVVRRADVPRRLRPRSEQLFTSAFRISAGLDEPNERVPSKPIFGGLPVARLIPQDVHSVLDYVHSACFFVSAALAKTGRARMVGAVLGATVGGASALSDTRLSAAHVVSVEAREKLDYATGLVAIAAPFVLGYAKKDRIAMLLHVGLGVGTIVTALFTDYRATRGITTPTRSNGGPVDGRAARGPQASPSLRVPA